MILLASLFNTPINFFNSEEVPTILVKIKNGSVDHQLPNWSGDTWTSYGSWSSYLDKAYVKNRTEGATVGSYTFTKHCVLIHESDDPNVPVGTKYGSACPADIVAKTCPENATIVDGLCECDSGFELVNGICQPDNSTSGRSDPPFTGTCADPNDSGYGQPECVGCNDGYEDNSDGLGCVEIQDDDDDDDDDDESSTPWLLYGGIGLVGLLIISKMA